MPVRGALFLQMFRNFRVVWIGGRYGSFKTALSVRLAYEFIQRGWADHMICNFPCVFATGLRRLPDLRKTFIILDEGGSGGWLNERSFGDIAAFLRKRDLYLCIPSVAPVNLRARMLNVQMSWDAHAIGIDAVIYSMQLDYMRVKAKSRLFWTKTSEIYGTYDTTHVAPHSGAIIPFIRSVFKADGVGEPEANPNDDPLTSLVNPFLYQRFEQEVSASPSPDSALSSGQGSEDLESFRRVADDTYEAAQRIEDAVSVYQKRRKRSRS